MFPQKTVASLKERKRFLEVLLRLTDADEDSIRKKSNPIALALVQNGIYTLGHLYAMSQEQIVDLKYDKTATVPTRNGGKMTKVVTVHLLIPFKQQLKMIVAGYHEFSYQAKSEYPMENINIDIYDAWRVSEFDASGPIVPWMTRIKKEKKESEAKTSDPIAVWKKNIRPNPTYFKELKDMSYWPNWEQKYLLALKSMGLEHLSDPDHVPENEKVDKLQQAWFYKVLEDKITEPTACLIVLKYMSKPEESRELWQERHEEFTLSQQTLLQRTT